MEVKVLIKNPPAGATGWFISLYPWDGEGSVSPPDPEADGLPLNVAAVMNVPDSWSKPLRFYIFAFYWSNLTGGLVNLYQAQSVSTTLPYYIEEFMYPPYDYFFNVTSQKLEWRLGPTTYQLTTSVEGSGSISPSSGEYNSGDQIILAANPDAGNQFVVWSGDIDGCTTVPGRPDKLQVTMDRDRHIVAEFSEAAEEYTLEATVVPAGAGTILKEPDMETYPPGVIVELTAQAASGYRFVAWTGSISDSNNPVLISMDGDKSIAAAFEGEGPVVGEPEFSNFGVVDYSRR